MKETMPRDRWLVQEGLKKVAEGPQAFTEWARQQTIDTKFMKMLSDMCDYAQKHNQSEIAKTFTFLHTCFQKLFQLPIETGTIAIGPENFKEVWNKANHYLQIGKPEEAVRLWEPIQLYLAMQQNAIQQGLADANLGITYAQLRQQGKALVFLKKASQNRAVPVLAQQKIWANLGTLYRDMGNVVQSVASYHKALELARDSNDIVLQVAHLQSLALLHVDQQEIGNAMVCQEEAYRIAQATEDKQIIQDAMTRLALLEGARGNPDGCKKLCEEALKLYPSLE